MLGYEKSDLDMMREIECPVLVVTADPRPAYRPDHRPANRPD